MKQIELSLYFIILSVFLFVTVASAETVRSYSECKYCPSTIYYNGEEVIKLLGKKGPRIVSKMPLISFKSIKIDLDGKKEIISGQGQSDDLDYEIIVNATPAQMSIVSNIDKSVIQFFGDATGLQAAPDQSKWIPEIHLRPSKGNRIKKFEKLESAWKKVKASKLYEWVLEGKDHSEWNKMLGQKIILMLRTVLTY